jgi:hypothetical protein
MQSKKDSSEGLWKASTQTEIAARSALQAGLAEYEPAVEACYEAGVQAAAVSARQETPEHLAVAGLFLKKLLTELRTAWLLVTTGYTSPAATVVASLWENALVVATVSNHPECVADIKAGDGDIPWGAQELAKRCAKDWTNDSLQLGVTDKYEAMWREVYGQYKWMCKIKHPTMRSAVHDAFSASVKSNEYVIMAAPDLRPQDRVAKVMLLSIAVTRSVEAITAFVAARKPQDQDPAYLEYGRMIRKILSRMRLFSDGLKGPLPFHIADEKVAAEYRELRPRPRADA